VTTSPQVVLDILIEAGAKARDDVLAATTGARARTPIRSGGGDDIFAIDEIAEASLSRSLTELCRERAVHLDVIMEGHEGPLVFGDPSADGTPWQVIIDPLDGSRPWIAGKRSAWVVLAAGRGAGDLSQLEVAATIEVPARDDRSTALIASATASGPSRFEREDLATGARHTIAAGPSRSDDFKDAFVSVARFAPGNRELLGRFEDQVLHGLGCLDDAQASSMGQLMEIALGRELAVIDPRPLFPGGGTTAHPYDLGGWLIVTRAGGIVEALAGGALAAPLDVHTPVAWVAFANEQVAQILRVRLRAALDRPGSLGQ
jgi:fructose-1,6-bisphosphatase/inositol monophosphatase family enzyme